MTHPLDIFRTEASLQTACAALYPGDPDSTNACVTSRVSVAQGETFGLLVGTAIGLLIGRFAFSGRR